MGEKIGYARVSTREQNLSSQEDALSKAGCIRIFTDKISGKEFNREGLKACMDYLRAEDTLVIYRLDRLGRSVKEMLDLCAQLESRRIKLVSLQDNLDTSTAVGRFTMQILASLAEYNRNLILEGCKAGIEAAQKRGVKFGRQTGVKMKKPKKEAVITMYRAGTSIKDIMSITGIRSIQTIYNYLKENGINAVFHYVPLHSAPAGEKFGRFEGEDVYTTNESERLIRLPMYYGLSDNEINKILGVINEFFKII